MTQSLGVEANNISTAASRGNSVQKTNLALRLLGGGGSGSQDADAPKPSSLWGSVSNGKPCSGEVKRPSETKLEDMDSSSDSDSSSSSTASSVATKNAVLKTVKAVSPQGVAISAYTPGGNSNGTASDSDEDEDPLEAFFQRATTLFNDAIDTMEATTWDVCSASAR